MKLLISLLSLVLLLQPNVSNADDSSDLEADSCGTVECLNLHAPTNANNSGKAGSRFANKNLAEALSKHSTNTKTEDSVQ